MRQGVVSLGHLHFSVFTFFFLARVTLVELGLNVQESETMGPTDTQLR